jgi:IstB-like ATP binding protein
MIDRLVHHAEVVALKGDSYRLKDRDLGGCQPTTKPDQDPTRVNTAPAPGGQKWTGVDTSHVGKRSEHQLFIGDYRRL